MAILFDNSSLADSSNWISNQSNISFSHTCSSGLNRALVVYTLNTSSALSVTGVTYNGVAMTQIVNNTTNFRNTAWILLNPDSGTHNVIVSFGSGAQGNEFCAAASYTGVLGYDNSNFTFNGNLSSGSVITSVAGSNEWVVGCTTYASSPSDDTYTNATKRGVMNSAQGGRVWDSNGVVSSGNYTVTASGATQERAMFGVSLTAISASTPNILPFFQHIYG